jgi:hypothetical protein
MATTAAAKKSSARKTSTAKKSAGRPASAKKAAPRKTAGAKKAAPRKASTAKKSSARQKSAAKKTTAKKPAGRKAVNGRRKYSRSVGSDVQTELHEMHAGTLKSGRSNKKVTNPKQAIAISLSEARRSGKKVPPNPNRTSGKKRS